MTHEIDIAEVKRQFADGVMICRATWAKVLDMIPDPVQAPDYDAHKHNDVNNDETRGLQ